jgi:2-methylisocitrate lyase-like PEP mutase family enzyme
LPYAVAHLACDLLVVKADVDRDSSCIDSFVAMPTQQEKAARFVELHRGEPFVIPNPWDVGSARVLESLGFPALTSTSSGFAFTLGRLDGEVTLQELCGHVAAISAATRVPFAVDIENGYGESPADVAHAITCVADAGAVGGSIEDCDRSGRLYTLGEATARVQAAREASAALGFPFVVVARAENHIRGNPDLDDTITRLCAFEEAGADVLYAPGLATTAEIRAVCKAVRRPVNVLAWPGLTVADIFAAGAQRVSVGGSLAWAGIEAIVQAAERIRDSGDLSTLGSSRRVRGWLTDQGA